MPRAKMADSRALALAWYAFLAIPAVVPLVLGKFPLSAGGPLTASGHIIPKFFALAMLTAISLAAWAVALLRAEIELRHVGESWLVVAFLGLATASTAVALNRPTALFGEPTQMTGLLTFLLAGAIYFLATQLVTDARRMRTVAFAVLTGGAIVALVGALQFLGIDPLRTPLDPSILWPINRAPSFIGNPDSAGTYLVFPLILAVALAFAEKNRQLRIAAGASSVVIAFALFVTLTRGAWIGAFIGLALFAVAFLRSGAKLPRALPAVTAFAVLAIAIAAWDWGPELVRRFRELLLGRAAGGGRFILWDEAVRIVTAHPLLGVGPDSYRYGWYPIRSLDSVALQGSAMLTNDPHNFVLLLAATLGIPAALVAIALLGVVLVRSAPAAFAKPMSSDRLIISGWWAALAGFAIALFFTFNTIPATLVLWLGLGTLTAARAKTVAVSRTTVLAFAAVTFVFSAAVAIVAPLSLASDFTTAQAKAQSSLALANQAVGLAPWNFDARVEQAYLSGLPAVLALQNGGTVSPALLKQADRATAELIAFNPHSTTGHSLRTTLFLELGSKLGTSTLEAAVAAADAGLKIEPTSTELAIKKARALLALDRPGDATRTLALLWDADPTDSAAGVVYVESLLADGQPGQAARAIKALAASFPDDPEVARVKALLPGAPAAP